MITRSVLFSLKCTRNRKDPLEELERSPDPLAVLRGWGLPGREGKRDIVALHTTLLRIDC